MRYRQRKKKITTSINKYIELSKRNPKSSFEAILRPLLEKGLIYYADNLRHKKEVKATLYYLLRAIEAYSDNTKVKMFRNYEATKELIKEFIERSKIFIRVKTKHNELRLESTFNKLLNKDDELAFFFVKQYAKPVIEFIMNNRFIDVEIDDNIKLKFKDNMNNNIYINIIKSMSLKKFLKTYKNNNKKDDSNSFKPLYNFLIDILLKLHIDTNTTKDMLKQMIIYKILSDYSTDEICKLYGSDILYLNNAGSSECNFEKLIFAIEFFINELSSIS